MMEIVDFVTYMQLYETREGVTVTLKTLKNEDVSDHYSYKNYLRSSENKA